MEVDVAIIGAGPYGLSVAAHLRAAGIDHRIFGHPMELWRHHMPEGMLLKSDGFASNLYDPAGEYPLSRFCGEHSIEYSDDQIPVRLETFIDYGRAFADRFAPNLEETTIHSLRRRADGFAFYLENGTSVRARRIVAATGIGPFRHVPPPLSTLAATLVSHSYDHRDLGRFAGRRVAVVGGGASAIDMAALLKQQECDVTLICRREKLVFANPPPSARSLWQRIRNPRSGIGPGLKSRLCTDAPLLFHLMPDAFRQEVVRSHLGPAAGWPMRQMFVDRVPALCGCEVVGASAVDQGVRLELRRATGETAWVHADHVIAATGYRVDIRRLDYMDRTLVAQLAHVSQSPVLSMHFESSVEGLFLTGPIAANSFGPMMRFAFGAGFAARRLASMLRRSARTELRSSKGLQFDAWAEK
ncbi:NAD(P)-binding domain-containing protein [Bradyrhizobium guangdongense]|uniref:NAD(P)-binding domain-containing protein n=1 Tax=Bradyrhizobium guangdongense TaxID=1325090 RepID=UPI001319EF35|nr:NAD(P)-binding domain-containing protein [Bradyrhizobium guangdongense]